MGLSKLPSIGNVLEDKLRQVGIETRDDLQNVGSKDAFLRIKSIDEGACLNTLYALEGALQGVRWHYLSDADKKNLKSYYQSIK
ncbi:MAG: TfoX/Sxy family protein [Firmicutes bacterium]|nr:TfoX/Sxy family protein [Bacillota bacterium]